MGSCPGAGDSPGPLSIGTVMGLMLDGNLGCNAHLCSILCNFIYAKCLRFLKCHQKKSKLEKCSIFSFNRAWGLYATLFYRVLVYSLLEMFILEKSLK